MTETHPRLEIRNLKRAYGGRAVVDDVSLKIMPGQVTCLLGPSGCGKSTTLRMIAGVEMQDSGSIHVDGKLICDTVFNVPPERREIGLMFQDFALFPHLSVADNVGFGLKTGTKAERRARIEELLERVDLLRFIDGYPHQLSGGEQQRVALARALRGHLLGLEVTAVTSADKYARQGWLRRGARNLWTLIRYFAGVAPAKLAEGYAK